MQDSYVVALRADPASAKPFRTGDAVPSPPTAWQEDPQVLLREYARTCDIRIRDRRVPVHEAMVLDRIYQPASLDAHLQDENGDDKSSFWEAIGRMDPEMAAIEERESLRRALDHLDPRQREIIYYRFFEDASQAEVARRLGIS